jgi:hypothetical protein
LIFFVYPEVIIIILGLILANMTLVLFQSCTGGTALWWFLKIIGIIVII